jgi:hypothetical protein
MKGKITMPTMFHFLTAKSRVILLSFAIILFLSAAASAQTTSTSNILMLPNGTSQACESAAGAQLPACNSFVPGAEPFLLLIKAGNTHTTNYRYTVIATLEDGSTRIVSGQIQRSDDGAGYTSTSVDLGCIAVTVDATIEEAA